MGKPTRFRTINVKIHRYVGLVLAFFLIIIAATGSIIAFYNDLERAFNPHMRVVTPQKQGWTLHDALVIRDRLEAEDPRARVFSLQFPQTPDEPLFSRVMPTINPQSGENYDIDYYEVFANPYTGERLGQRIIGKPTLNPSGLYLTLPPKVKGAPVADRGFRFRLAGRYSLGDRHLALVAAPQIAQAQTPGGASNR